VGLLCTTGQLYTSHTCVIENAVFGDESAPNFREGVDGITEFGIGRKAANDFPVVSIAFVALSRTAEERFHFKVKLLHFRDGVRSPFKPSRI
jgi:hypothetical protein